MLSASTEHIINEFFTLRYKYITECAFNILKLIRRTDLKHTLVSEAFLHVNSNQEKIYSQIEKGKLESVVINWMTMQVKWSNTKFKKEFVYPHKHHSDSPIEELESFVLIDEDVNEEELLENEKEIQDKLNSIQVTMLSLPLEEQELYKYIYIDGIDTSGKLSKFTGLARTGCYYLMKNLKEKLRNNYENGII